MMTTRRRRALLAGMVLAFLATSVFVTAGRAQDAEALHLGAEGFALANGMQVVVIPNHRVPAVTQMVWYKAGAADEPRGTSGIAHFVEHLMFRGTSDIGPGLFSRIVAANGGRDNAFTAEDYTAFHQTVAADRLELVMKMEADRMSGLVISDAVVTPERQVILEERRSRIDNSPEAQLDEQARTAIYLNHPYRIPTIGWLHDMERLTTEDAIAWYRAWYHPNNAVLIVAGDVTVDQVRVLAEKYYAPIQAQAVPARPRLFEPPHVAATRLEMKSPRAARATWSRSFLAPSYTGGETKHAYALQVLSEILGGGATSRLNRSIVLDQKLALYAGSYYNPGALDLSIFGVYASPREGVSIAQLEAAIEAEIGKLLEGGAGAEEVARAKARMQTAAIYERDSLTGPANIIGAALAAGRTIEDVEAWPARIGAVTVAEVDAAARMVIQERTGVTAILLPEHDGAPPTGPAAPPPIAGSGRVGAAPDPLAPVP